MTEFINIVQIAQSCNQTDNSAQNAQCRRIGTCLGEHRASLRVALLHDRQLRVEDITNELRIHTVDDHIQARAKERILDLPDLVLQSQQALTTGDLGQLDKQLKQFCLLLQGLSPERHLDQIGEILQLFHLKTNEQA